ncbi:hypothetical protein RU98_GL000428 [Enterococcus caccae]|nr:hypothetical protein RU98_GL000428 [Enterococcus caccae]
MNSRQILSQIIGKTPTKQKKKAIEELIQLIGAHHSVPTSYVF